MKHQQVSVDFVNMVFTAFTYVALAGALWIFLRLLQACFSLPKHMKKQNDIQQMLHEKVESYEKYIEQCEAKERAAAEYGESVVSVDGDGKEQSQVPVIDEAKWKERRECLEMLKKELRRVRDGGDDQYDWDYLLEGDEEEEKENNEKSEMKNEETCNSKTRLNSKKDESEGKETATEQIVVTADEKKKK